MSPRAKSQALDSAWTLTALLQFSAVKFQVSHFRGETWPIEKPQVRPLPQTIWILRHHNNWTGSKPHHGRDFTQLPSMRSLLWFVVWQLLTWRVRGIHAKLFFSSSIDFPRDLNDLNRVCLFVKEVKKNISAVSLTPAYRQKQCLLLKGHQERQLSQEHFVSRLKPSGKQPGSKNRKIKTIEVYFSSEVWTEFDGRGDFGTHNIWLNRVLTCQSHWVSGLPLGRGSVSQTRWTPKKTTLAFSFEILKIKYHTSSHDLQKEGHPECEAFVKSSKICRRGRITFSQIHFLE